MIEAIVLGLIQGIAEWLPVSSEGVIVLIKSNFFTDGSTMETSIKLSLFLHLGTLFSAVIYFHKDIIILTKTSLCYKHADTRQRKTLIFLIVTTLISGCLGYLLLKIISQLEDILTVSTKAINIFIGMALLITAFLQLRPKRSSTKTTEAIGVTDAILLGIIQGFAVLPGLSRSGLTVSTLLLRRYNESTALKLSFLMSIPIVIAGNIAMNLDQLTFSTKSITALAFSFIFGIVTIHGLLRLAKKINFGFFVLIFGVLVIVSSFL